MLDKVEAYVSKWHMLEKEDKIIAGVSGGADSICLLFVLMELQKKIPFEIIAVHVNHGLRGKQADADESYVKQICEKYQIPCICYRENVELIAKNRKQSTEEAGRDIRREAFRRTMEQYGGTKIALAHHQNDNVETFLMNLSRGTGLKGLGGIRPVAGEMIRPLLCLERSEIEAYLKQNGISYCTDVTNAEDDYTRNRIRNHVIPYLEAEVNPRTVFHINETMERLLELQSFLDEQTKFYLETCVKKQETGYIVMEDSFGEVSTALKPLVLKEVLVRISGKEKDIEAIHLEVLQELLGKQVGKKVDLPYDMEGKRTYEGIRVQKKMAANTKKQNVMWEISFADGKEQEFCLGNQKIRCCLLENQSISLEGAQKSNTKRFDYDIITRRVCIRTRQPGDYITIHPDGRTQKLKAFFINEKIPEEKRDEILLVADGSHILWIAGYRTNPLYQVKENTRQVLEIQMNKGD